MNKLQDRINSKIKKYNRLKNNPRVRSVLSFLIHKGFLISNESFGEAQGVPSIKDFLFVAKNFEPRVYTVIPAFFLHYRNSIKDVEEIPDELKEIIQAIEKGKDIELSFRGIHFREMKSLAEMKLNDKRVKPVGEKKITKTFRLSPKAVAKLEEIALKESKNITSVLEEMILGYNCNFVLNKTGYIE